MRYDIYDLILEVCGYGNPALKISQETIIKHEEEISALLKEIGLEESQNTFDLYIANDDEHDMMEACLTIYDVSNQFGIDCDSEKAESLMFKAHHTGKSKIASGPYSKMYEMKLALKKEGFSSLILKTETLKK